MLVRRGFAAVCRGSLRARMKRVAMRRFICNMHAYNIIGFVDNACFIFVSFKKCLRHLCFISSACVIATNTLRSANAIRAHIVAGADQKSSTSHPPHDTQQHSHRCPAACSANALSSELLASANPLSAAHRHHFTAAAKSASTPSPCLYMNPKQYLNEVLQFCVIEATGACNA